MNQNMVEKGWQAEADRNDFSVKEKECLDKYGDIIHLTHPISRKHPQMPLADRAAQFSPFAALNGYEDALKETLEQAIARVAHEVETESCQFY